MEKENVFKKLRHLAAKVEKESRHIETCINMPAHMRPGARSAELILKELQCNVQTMTLQAQKDLKELQEQTSFRNLLENVEVITKLTGERINILEENLMKYGYKKAVVETNVKKQLPADSNTDKENREPDQTDNDSSSNTPPQTPKQVSASDVHKIQDNQMKTPTLADFGISRATLDFLANQNMASQRKKSAQNGTPFKKLPAAPTSPADHNDAESPFDANVVFTPGLFGHGRKVPTATPEHMQGSVYQTPGNMTRTLKDDATICFGFTTPFQSRSMASIHPTPIGYHASIMTQTITQPKNMWQAETTNDNTPTIPDLQYQPPRSPDNPQLIANPTDMQTQVLLKGSSDQGNDTPTEPHLMGTLPEKPPEGPVLLSHGDTVSSRTNINGSHKFTTPFKAFKNFNIEDDMPKTPELTFSYARYVDVGASLASTKEQTSDSTDIESGTRELVMEEVTTTQDEVESQPTMLPETTQQPSKDCHRSGAIAFISEEEFLEQSSFLQRLLPLEDVNAWIKKINKYMARKKDSQYLLESEISNLGMGPRAKAMLLLLVKLKRLAQARPNAAGDQAYQLI